MPLMRSEIPQDVLDTLVDIMKEAHLVTDERSLVYETGGHIIFAHREGNNVAYTVGRL